MNNFKYVTLVEGRPEVFIPVIGAGAIETSAVAIDNTCKTNTAISDFIHGRTHPYRSLSVIQEIDQWIAENPNQLENIVYLRKQKEIITKLMDDQAFKLVGRMGDVPIAFQSILKTTKNLGVIKLNVESADGFSGGLPETLKVESYLPYYRNLINLHLPQNRIDLKQQIITNLKPDLIKSEEDFLTFKKKLTTALKQINSNFSFDINKEGYKELLDSLKQYKQEMGVDDNQSVDKEDLFNAFNFYIEPIFWQKQNQPISEQIISQNHGIVAGYLSDNPDERMSVYIQFFIQYTAFILDQKNYFSTIKENLPNFIIDLQQAINQNQNIEDFILNYFAITDKEVIAEIKRETKAAWTILKNSPHFDQFVVVYQNTQKNQDKTPVYIHQGAMVIPIGDFLKLQNPELYNKYYNESQITPNQRIQNNPTDDKKNYFMTVALKAQEFVFKEHSNLRNFSDIYSKISPETYQNFVYNNPNNDDGYCIFVARTLKENSNLNWDRFVQESGRSAMGYTVKNFGRYVDWVMEKITISSTISLHTIEFPVSQNIKDIQNNFQLPTEQIKILEVTDILNNYNYQNNETILTYVKEIERNSDFNIDNLRTLGQNEKKCLKEIDENLKNKNKFYELVDPKNSEISESHILAKSIFGYQNLLHQSDFLPFIQYKAGVPQKIDSLWEQVSRFGENIENKLTEIINNPNDTDEDTQILIMSLEQAFQNLRQIYQRHFNPLTKTFGYFDDFSFILLNQTIETLNNLNNLSSNNLKNDMEILNDFSYFLTLFATPEHLIKPKSQQSIVLKAVPIQNTLKFEAFQVQNRQNNASSGIPRQPSQNILDSLGGYDNIVLKAVRPNTENEDYFKKYEIRNNLTLAAVFDITKKGIQSQAQNYHLTGTTVTIARVSPDKQKIEIVNLGDTEIVLILKLKNGEVKTITLTENHNILHHRKLKNQNIHFNGDCRNEQNVNTYALEIDNQGTLSTHCPDVYTLTIPELLTKLNLTSNDIEDLRFIGYTDGIVINTDYQVYLKSQEIKDNLEYCILDQVIPNINTFRPTQVLGHLSKIVSDLLQQTNSDLVNYLVSNSKVLDDKTVAFLKPDRANCFFDTHRVDSENLALLLKGNHLNWIFQSQQNSALNQLQKASNSTKSDLIIRIDEFLNILTGIPYTATLSFRLGGLYLLWNDNKEKQGLLSMFREVLYNKDPLEDNNVKEKIQELINKFNAYPVKSDCTKQNIDALIGLFDIKKENLSQNVRR